jgi:hypothetical protein
MRTPTRARAASSGVLAAMSAMVAGTAALLPGPASADPPPLRETELPEANFAFAHRLGTGIYEISGRTVQVYSLPFERRLRTAEDDRAGLVLTLPVTLGFFDFKVQDVLESGLPTDVATLSFVPGLRWEIALGEGWELQPFIEAGIARDRTDDLRARVATVGTTADWRGGSRHGALRWHHSLAYARSRIDGAGADDFALWVTGAEVVRPLDTRMRGHPLDWAPYAAVRWYPDAPAVPLLASAPSRGITRLQGEFGVTFGTVHPVKIAGIGLPRIGIGYRFGEELSVFRLVIGERF